MDGPQIGNLKHNVTYTDLREYIEEVDRLSELRRIGGATWDEDIGLATELLQHSEAALSALFDEIPASQWPSGVHQYLWRPAPEHHAWLSRSPEQVRA